MKSPFSQGLRSGDTYYKTYRKDDGVLDRKTFQRVLDAIMLEIKEYILDGYIVQLPFKVGTLFIRGKEQRLKWIKQRNSFNFPVDWPATYELWGTYPECKEKKQLVYVENEHTSGVVYRVVYSLNGTSWRFKRYIQFKPCRTLKRQLAKKIKAGQKYYTK